MVLKEEVLLISNKINELSFVIGEFINSKLYAIGFNSVMDLKNAFIVSNIIRDKADSLFNSFTQDMTLYAGRDSIFTANGGKTLVTNYFDIKFCLSLYSLIENYFWFYEMLSTTKIDINITESEFNKNYNKVLKTNVIKEVEKIIEINIDDDVINFNNFKKYRNILEHRYSFYEHNPTKNPKIEEIKWNFDWDINTNNKVIIWKFNSKKYFERKFDLLEKREINKGDVFEIYKELVESGPGIDETTEEVYYIDVLKSVDSCFKNSKVLFDKLIELTTNLKSK